MTAVTCKSFTCAVAHEALHRDEIGIGTTEWQLGAEACTWLLVETSRITPHVT